jgi:hypothetical protein
MNRKSKISKGKKNKSKSSRSQGVLPGESRRGDNTAIMETWMPVFPARTFRRHRYGTYISLAGTSGAVASYVFSANGMFDPDITSTGHQPMGFDQLILSYNHYTVVGARLTATFHNNATTTPNACVSVNGSVTPVTVATDLIEVGMNNHTVLGQPTGSDSVKTLEAKVSIKKFEGVDDPLDVIDLRGSAAANPAEQTYFHVQTWDSNLVTTSTIVEVIIEFAAVWTEPRVLTPSLRLQMQNLLRNEERKTRGECQLRK